MDTIVVSGATKGIGRAISKIFAENGYNLAICSRTEQDLENMAQEFEKAYKVEVFYKACDVSEKKEVIAFGKAVAERFGKIDVLVNNAGLFIPGEIMQEEDGALEQMVETNLYSAYHLSRTLLPSIKKSKKAHIFNICSTASITAYENGGSYCIAKFGMYGMSKVMREELKSDGIKVSSILPGPTYTASWEGADVPKERFMQSEEVAELVYSSYCLKGNAVVEDLVMRPQLGDL